MEIGEAMLRNRHGKGSKHGLLVGTEYVLDGFQESKCRTMTFLARKSMEPGETVLDGRLENRRNY
jgi:hypothetical protein